MASSSSLAIRCAGNHGVSSRRQGSDNNPANLRARRPCSLALRKRAESKGQTGRTISVKMAAKATEKLEPRRTRGNGATVAGEKLDDWMRRSVVDIVKNLREAPLMVLVYGDGDKSEESGGGVTRIETEKGVVEEDWQAAKGKWESGEAPVPQGLIFVEELEEEEEEEEQRSDRESTTRAWGIVVQGRGAECGPVCYLLKTSRVRGLGSMFCTHFCLARVNGFRESAASQLKNCWLLQAAASSRPN